MFFFQTGLAEPAIVLNNFRLDRPALAGMVTCLRAAGRGAFRAQGETSALQGS